MKIRKYKKSDTYQVAKLIFKTYKKFNSLEFSHHKSAAQKYMDHFDPMIHSKEDLYKIFIQSSVFFIAEEDNKIVGIIRGKTNKISNLFVDKTHHKKGIATKLIIKFENEIKKQGITEIKIKSTLYATGFYQKMKYKKTTGIRNFMGLKIYPMKKILD